MYRINKRKYSPNIIEIGCEEGDNIKWKPFIAPLVSKKQGDKLCERLVLFLSEIEKHDNIVN